MEKKQIDVQAIEVAFRQILEAMGEDPTREGLKDTPKRVAKMYAEIYAGMYEDPRDVLAISFEEEVHEEIVIVKDIPFYSTCEHHFVPFYGKAHIAYLPGSRLTGLSKLARTVEIIARRPQLQERISQQIADAIEDALSPKGVFVVIEAEHMCMTMRGIKKPGSKTVTTVARGIYAEDFQARQEVLQLLKF
ncbi:MAG: GTP cyclohydrolase I FolE [Culicoidibacterales bacterium]